MKLTVELSGESIDVEIKKDGDKTVALVGDREYSLEISEPEPSTFLMKNEGKIFEARTSPHATAGVFDIRIGAHEFTATVTDPKRLRGVKGDAALASGKAEIKTAMPGKVVRILVAVGDTVETGSGVIVVEAMKMQNEMRSPKGGTVAQIRVAEGDTVSAGDVLVIIE